MFETAQAIQENTRQTTSLESIQHYHPAQNRTFKRKDISKTRLKPCRYRTISDRSSFRYFTHLPASPEDLSRNSPGKETAGLRAEFLNFLNFDLMMDYYQLRPVKISDFGSCQPGQIYQPLVLLTFRRDIAPAKYWQPILADIWSREDLKNNWSWMRSARRRAKELAREKNWRFHLLTESFFALPFYRNVKFLVSYISLAEHGAEEQRLYEKMRELEISTVAGLLEATANSREESLDLTSSLWRMIARYDIRCNLKFPLNMDTVIWRDGFLTSFGQPV